MFAIWSVWIYRINDAICANMSTVRPTSPAVASHFNPDPPHGEMSFQHALSAFHALSPPTRLEIFRLRVSREPEGAAAGTIAELVGGPHNTVSQLARGPSLGGRQGPSIIYQADVALMGALMSFMLTDQAARCSDFTGFMCAGGLIEMSAIGDIFTNSKQQQTSD